MAKKDLKEATKAATMGMFTPKTQNDKPEVAGSKKDNTVTKEKTNTTSAKTDEPVSQKTKKQANDYLYLDLRPTGGADLKAYVMEQAHRTSVAQGRNISATNYIQNLIKKDMDNEKSDTTKAKIIEMLDNTTDEKLEVIYTVVKNII